MPSKHHPALFQRQKGTTLVEVIVASAILVSVISLLTTALSSTFQSYGIIKSTAQIDQDGQYILARLSYASAKSDANIVGYDTTTSHFTRSGALLSSTQTTTTEDGEVQLTSVSTTGSYTSAVTALPTPKAIQSLVATTSKVTRSSMGYQVAARSMVSGVCSSNDADYTYSPPMYTAPPIAWYKMDEASWTGVAGEVTNSGSASGGAGVRAGSATTTSTAKYINAGTFNGTTDYVTITDTTALGSTNLSVMGWINPTTVVAGAPIYNRRTAANVGGVTLEIGASNNINCYMYITGAWRVATSAASSIPTNTWTHVACAYDGSTIRLYLNSNLVASTSIAGTINNPATPTVQVARNITNSALFNGKIDDIRIYDYSRTPGQILSDMNGNQVGSSTNDLYEVGTTNLIPATQSTEPPLLWYKLDETSWAGASGEVVNIGSGGTAVSGTASGGATTTTTSQYGRAGLFDGVNDYVNVPTSTTLDLTNTLTVSAWVRAVDIAGQTYPPILKRATSTAGYSLEVDHTTNLVSMYLYIGGAWRRSPTATLSPNTWTHVTSVYDGSYIYLYINGVSAGTPTAQTGAIVAATGQPLRIGHDSSNPTRYFDGQLDEVKLYNYVRTPEQIKTDMMGGVADCVKYRVIFNRADTGVSTPTLKDVTIRNI